MFQFIWGSQEDMQLQRIAQSALLQLCHDPLKRIIDVVSDVAVKTLKNEFKVTKQISRPGEMPNLRSSNSPLKTNISRAYELEKLTQDSITYILQFYNVIIPGLDAGRNNVPGTLERGGLRKYLHGGVMRNYRYRPRPYMAVLLKDLLSNWVLYVEWAKSKLGYS